MTLKIDIHTHILPKDWPNLKERYGYGGWVQLEHSVAVGGGCGCAKMLKDGNVFRQIEANCWDPQIRIEEYKSHQTQVQVLSTVPVMFNYWAKPKDTLDLAKRLNDHIAEVVNLHPHHFVGLATLPMQAPDLAVLELERCINELGLRGAQIGSHINQWNLDDEHLFPVFQACEELSAALFIHPWDMMGADRMKKYWLPWLVSMPAETSLAICSMIFGGVLERLPKLRVAFAHGGGSFPSTLGRIEHGFNVRPDLCAVDNAINPRHYAKKIYYDSLVHDPLMMRYLLDLVGPEQIALGSDYPFPLGDLQPGKLIDELGISAKSRQRIFSGTALEWLDLPASQFEQGTNVQ